MMVGNVVRQKALKHTPPSPAENNAEQLTPLWEALTEANRLFQANEASKRRGVIHAVQVVLEHLKGDPRIGDRGLIVPLVVLYDALVDLDQGHTQPLLGATLRRSGRANSGGIRKCHMGAAVFTVRRLCGAGMSHDRALKAVAKALTDAGIKASRGAQPHLTDRTIRGWCERIAEDVGGRGEAARTIQLLEDAIPEGWTGTEAQKAYLTILADKVKALGDGGT